MDCMSGSAWLYKHPGWIKCQKLAPGGGGGGGHSGTEGGRTFVTYFAEEGVFF